MSTLSSRDPTKHTNTLCVKNLSKRYSSFTLDSVSFDLDEGQITGFIGRNGSGKTTTIKSLLNLIHPDAGSVSFFGLDFSEHELKIKPRIGYAAGGIDYYPKAKIATITKVTSRFYDTWDHGAYSHYLKLFGLDETKTPSELSAGMRVKYSLALALSHKAQILLLDEPTSGLDPISRDDLLDLFMELKDGGTTILFSTHITSDLDKCTDNILYIKQGRIAAHATMDEYLSGYKVVKYTPDQVTDEMRPKLIGQNRDRDGFTALVAAQDAPGIGLATSNPNLETIMIHMEKE